jgi:ubiquinone/menaquinone biosynthesis C-methylase UbiE
MAEELTQHATQVRQLFDSLAVVWPEGYVQDGRFAGRLARFATAAGSCVAPRSHILELGCGTGEMARAMAAMGFRVTACDISEQMLRGASSAKCADAVEWIQLEPHWRNLPFLSRSFDAVVASSVLEYVEEPTIVLSECARVLGPTGVMLCTVPDPSHPIRWLEQLAKVIARLPIARVAGRRWPSLDGYMTYLEVSKQRHPLRWWSTAATRAGLFPIHHLPDTESRSPLRLLGFRQSADVKGNS